MCSDFLEGEPENSDGEENIQTDIRSERAVLGRERNRTLRFLAVWAESRLNRLLRHDLLWERDIFNEAGDGLAPPEEMPAVRTGMKRVMRPIRNLVRLRQSTAERGRRTRLLLRCSERGRWKVVVVIRFLLPSEDHGFELLNADPKRFSLRPALSALTFQRCFQFRTSRFKFLHATLPLRLQASVVSPLNHATLNLFGGQLFHA